MGTSPHPMGWASLALAIGLATGCLDPVRPARPPARPTAIEVPTAEPPAPTGPEHATIQQVEPHAAAFLENGELIAGQREALAAFRADGSGYRVISPGAALFPRRFGRDHVLALRPLAPPELRDGFALDLIALDSGQRRELAQVPAFQCVGRTEPASLTIQEPLDLEVDPERGVACLGLMDAAANRAQLRVRVRVDLRAPRVQRWLALGEDSCTPPPDVEVGDPAPDGSCWESPSVVRPLADSTAFPFTFAEEHLRMPAAPRGGTKTRLRGYQVEEPSPSGRWLLLAGDYVERDVVYRRLLLLDRAEGRLYPIPPLPGLWPPPLTAAGGQFKTPVREAQPIAASTDVRWLAAGATAELLVLDTRVVRPGERVFDVSDGWFAR